MTGDVGLLVAQAWRLAPRRVIVQVAALIASGLLAGASLLLLIPIVNSLSDSSASISVPLLGSLSLASVPLWALLAMFVALIAVQALVSQVSAVSTTRVQQVLIDHLRQEAFAAVLAARWSFVIGRRRSDVVTTISVGAVRAGMAYNQLLQFGVATVFAVVSAIIALVISPAVAVFAIIGVIAMASIQALSVRPSHRLGVELGERQRTMQAVITDSLDSLRLVRAHSAAAVWTDRLADAFAGARDVQLTNVRRQSMVNGLTSVGAAIAASLLVLICVALDVPPATIVVVLAVVLRLALSARQMVSAAALMSNSLPAVRDLSQLTTDALAEAEAGAGPSTRKDLSEASEQPLIELSRVTYAYPGGDRGVRDLSLTVPRGRITALVGPSGAGKSTAVDLMLGLLSPDAGEVLVDGLPLTTSDLEWWRGHVAYVPQETLLIPGTLRDNLTWSVQRACSDEECWEALDRAAATFARHLPAHLDTVLGDRGIRISGGERQRVAIARALLRRPGFLVLDEATSALDDESETAVLDLLRSLVPEVTIVVVAHRRSTIDAADLLVEFH